MVTDVAVPTPAGYIIIEVEKDDKDRYRCLVKNSVGDEFLHETFLIVSKLVMCSSTLDNGLRMHECV